MFYNNTNHFKMGGFVVSPISLVVPSTSVAFTATVVIAGISIVVAVLVLLIFVFYLFGKIVSTAEAKAKNKKSTQNNEPVQEIKPNAIPAPMPIPDVEDGISGEVVAAIAAAVAVSEGSGAVVRSIKKKNVSGRNPWSSAATYENTRPF